MIFLKLFTSLIFFITAVSAQGTRTMIAVPDHQNPARAFKIHVCTSSIHDAVNITQNYCQEKSDATLNTKQQNQYQQWSNNAHTYMKRYMREVLNGRTKMVIGCGHDERSIIESSDGNVFVSREGEDHTHAGYVSVVSAYKSYRNGHLYTYPPTHFGPISGTVFNPDDNTTHHIQSHACYDFNECAVDFLRFYPTGEGSGDFPTDYFSEIYMERAGFEHGIESMCGYKEGLKRIARQLREGGYLVFDYDGPQVTIMTENVVPEYRDSCGITQTLIGYTNGFYRKIFLYPQSKLVNVYDSGQIKLYQKSSEHYVLTVKTWEQCKEFSNAYKAWMDVTHMPKILNPHIPVRFQSHWDKHPISALYKRIFMDIWQKGADQQTSILTNYGFTNATYHCDEVNPRNNRQHARWIEAQFDNA